MVLHKLQGYKPRYTPTNETEHFNDGDKYYKELSPNFVQDKNVPTITHGNKDSWDLNTNHIGGYSSSGDGIYSKDEDSGTLKFEYNNSGSPSYTTGYIGGDNNLTWLSTYGRGDSIFDNNFYTGLGFKYKRRTTSGSGPDNRNQHSNFLRRWGVQLRSKKNSNNFRFWSSDTIQTNGDYTPKETNVNYFFIQERNLFKDIRDFGGSDWTIYRVWFQISTRDDKKSGSSTSYTKIWGLRFYYDVSFSENDTIILPYRRSFAEVDSTGKFQTPT